MRRVHTAVRLAALLHLVAGSVHAHDLWIEPSSFRPAPGATLALRLRIGQQFVGDPMPRDPRQIRQFALLDEEGTTPVPGRAGDEPAGMVQPTASGVALVVYRSQRSPIELEAGKFESYLRDEGLERVSRTRADRGESDAPGREVFSRCAKALLAVSGGRPASGHDRAVGLTLELIPERSPYTLRPGDELPLVLRYEGAPLAGALVVGLDGDEASTVRARTDAAGRVRLRLARPGPWLVKAVHMVPAPPDTGADWESLWASLTFELPAE